MKRKNSDLHTMRIKIFVAIILGWILLSIIPQLIKDDPYTDFWLIGTWVFGIPFVIFLLSRVFPDIIKLERNPEAYTKIPMFQSLSDANKDTPKTIAQELFKFVVSITFWGYFAGIVAIIILVAIFLFTKT